MSATYRSLRRPNAERDQRIAAALRRGRTIRQVAKSHRLTMPRIRQIAHDTGVPKALLAPKPRAPAGTLYQRYEISAETREQWRREAQQFLHAQLRMGIPEAEAREDLAL